MNIKQRLETTPNLSKLTGAIAVSKTPTSKYFTLRRDIMLITAHLDDVDMKYRIDYVLNDCKLPVCGCGCGEQLKNYKSKYKKNHFIHTQEFRDKKTQTMIDKYGVDNPSKVPEFNQKKKDTYMKKYGVDNPMKSSTVKTTHKQSMIDAHGVDNPFKIPRVIESNKKIWQSNKVDIIQKRVQSHRKIFYEKLTTTSRLKSLVVPMFTVDDYIRCDDNYEFRCVKCDHTFISDIDDGKTPKCPVCFPSIDKRGISIAEVELCAWVATLTPIKTGTRKIISPFELDVYIPSKNLAIEYNGNYWHSELNGKDKNYHTTKTSLCNEVGVSLVHIFEDEWLFKGDIVKRRLKSMLGVNAYSIYARKCEVREIDNLTKRQFLEKYHIQGDDKSSIRLGLFYNDRLVAVMTFGKRRFDKKDGYELIRYCTIGNFTVVGGAGKLLKHFERNWNPKAVISYADLRWSEGGLYKALGFKHLRNSSPNYFYMKTSTERLSRHQFMKHKLKDKLAVFDEKLTEWENMKANGYDRIWDCGNMVFEKVY